MTLNKSVWQEKILIILSWPEKNFLKEFLPQKIWPKIFFILISLKKCLFFLSKNPKVIFIEKGKIALSLTLPILTIRPKINRNDSSFLTSKNYVPKIHYSKPKIKNYPKTGQKKYEITLDESPLLFTHTWFYRKQTAIKTIGAHCKTRQYWHSCWYRVTAPSFLHSLLLNIASKKEVILHFVYLPSSGA